MGGLVLRVLSSSSFYYLDTWKLKILMADFHVSKEHIIFGRLPSLGDALLCINPFIPFKSYNLPITLSK